MERKKEKLIYDRLIYSWMECSSTKWCNTSYYRKLETLILVS